MRARTIKIWHLVHKWTSLVCTLFLLMLCVTGLPLIFHEEIEHATGVIPTAPVMPVGTARASSDEIAAAAQRLYPEERVHYLSWDEHEPDLVFVTLYAPDASPDDFRILIFDSRTAALLNEPDLKSGFMYAMLTLHVDMFAGLPGKLFLGFMGLLFVAAIVSGVVLYAPFMRKLDFGAIRRDRTTRLKWLDLHNLLGIAAVAWVLVVGTTGIINTWADLVIQFWRYDQLAEMTAPYRDKPAPAQPGSLDAAVATAGTATPGMVPSFVAFPGSLLSSNHHYMVAMHGDTPLTARLIKPVLVDAVTAELTAMRDMPWYVTTLLVSQPLHFGDYGGVPLKIVWALLDIVTIIVLGSGLYLWLVRRRTSFEAQLAELERAQAGAAAE